MPMHDWTRVDAGIYHDFHHEWISEIKRALNRGRWGRLSAGRRNWDIWKSGTKLWRKLMLPIAPQDRATPERALVTQVF